MKAASLLNSLINTFSAEEGITTDQGLRFVETLKEHRLFHFCFAEEKQEASKLSLHQQTTENKLNKSFTKISKLLQSKNETKLFFGLCLLQEAIQSSTREFFQLHYEHWTNTLLNIIKVFHSEIEKNFLIVR
jgi:glutamate mutase epsilon subunit